MIKKRDFFKLHSWIGIKLSILFFIVCFSGTIATLSSELDWLFNPAIRAEPAAELAPRNRIRDALRARYPEANLTYWMKPEAPYLCDIVYVEQDGDSRYVFANPYTGRIQGEARITVQRYFRDLHYYLFIPFQVGHFIVLLFSFLLLASVLTALVFYKQWYRKLFILKTGKGPLVFFRSLHRLVGLWSIPFALLVACTGVWYFIERADVGSVSESLRVPVPRIDTTSYGPGGYRQELVYRVDYDRAIDSARQYIPSLRVETILPPYAAGEPLYLDGENEVPLVRSRANRVYLHPVTYEVLYVQRASQLNTTTWLNDIADPLHFGYWGGLGSKLIWFLMGLGISSLILSGIWIALKRKLQSRRTAQDAVIGRWHYVNWGVVALLFGFMYYFLLVRYGVDWPVLATVTTGWAVVGGLAYFIFVWRLRRSAGGQNPERAPSRPRMQRQRAESEQAAHP